MALSELPSNTQYMKYIPHQTEDMHLAAVRSIPNVIEYIDNPSENVCFAVNADYNNMEYVNLDIFEKPV